METGNRRQSPWVPARGRDKCHFARIFCKKSAVSFWEIRPKRARLPVHWKPTGPTEAERYRQFSPDSLTDRCCVRLESGSRGPAFWKHPNRCARFGECVASLCFGGSPRKPSDPGGRRLVKFSESGGSHGGWLRSHHVIPCLVSQRFFFGDGHDKATVFSQHSLDGGNHAGVFGASLFNTESEHQSSLVKHRCFQVPKSWGVPLKNDQSVGQFGPEEFGHPNHPNINAWAHSISAVQM